MDYKIVITDYHVDDEYASEIFQKLQKLVIDGKNIDMKNPAPFSVEGNTAVLIGTTWGVSRPDVEDMAEISKHYSDLTFHFIQASSILNGNHFEDLRNYSLSVYQNGLIREIMKPEPIVWKSTRVMEIRQTPWTS